MRPFRSFLLLLIFLVCFTGLHYIKPLRDLFPPVTEFIPDSSLRLRSDSSLRLRSANDSEPSRSLSGAEVTIPDSSLRLRSDSSLRLRSANDSEPSRSLSGAEVTLSHFMDSLTEPGRQTRILYYGDSQIEGDRITSWLRQSLRNLAGGTGPGLFLPVMPVMYTKTLWLRSSSNWERYNYLSYQDAEISHRMLGPMMAFCRYLPEGTIAESPEKAFVRIKPSAVSDSAGGVYEHLRIFYRNAEQPVDIVIRDDESIIAKDSLSVSDSLTEYNLSLNHPGEITIEFSGYTSPDIYGISIESKTGVVVDNLPLRGSAGLEFTMGDQNTLRKSFSLLDPDLIMLQFGLNIVRNVRADYDYYSRGLTRQLSLIKEILPAIPVIIIGLSDMAEGSPDSLRSFANIPAIIEAQKNAAEQGEAFFWNTWEAMGGESSIIKWSERIPPLAQKDYVHLTYEGADTLASIMADSLFFSHLKEQDEHLADTAQKAVVNPDAGNIAGQVEHSPGLAGVFSFDPENPMIFTTSAFWIFFLIVIAVYSLVYKKLFIRNFYLFLISLFFYYKSGGFFLFLLIFVTVIDFSIGLLLGSTRKRYLRKILLLLSIVSNLGILAYFKYTGFVIGLANDLLGTNFVVYDFLADISNSFMGTNFDISNIILPVGISFFTFQSLSYTIDVYKRKIRPVKNPFDFGFFVSFFPQLVAGPIVRASEFIPQLYVPYHLDKREFSHALFLICKGLIKKIIISDFIAVNFVDRVFDAPFMYSGFENLMAVYGYGLQIYCDFSGYTDIAIGLGLVLGFRLPLNFNSPYKAAGIADFWKRWHISLSRWLKDYLYIPLGGNRKGKFRTYVNLLITMVLGGLWHGASMRFIIWGFLHGAGLIVDRIVRQLSGETTPGRVRRGLAVFITFNFVNFCWIFFRAKDMESVKIMFSQITVSFSPGNWEAVLLSYSSVFLLIIAGYLIHFLSENFKESYRGFFIRVPLSAQIAAVMVVAILLYSMRATDTMPFIYFRF